MAAAGLTLVALALRWPLLGPSTLIRDDAWVALLARADTAAEALVVGPTTPGFSLALWAVLSVVGLSSISAQAIPFLAGVLTPALTYAVGVSRRLDPLAAGTAATLIALSPAHISLSGRIKQFTVETLLVAGLLLVAGRVCDRPGAPGRWAVLAILSLGAIVISAMTAVVVVGTYLAAGLAALRDRGGAAIRGAAVSGSAVAGISLAWWVLRLDTQVTAGLTHFWRDRLIEWSGDPAVLVADVWHHFVYLAEWFAPLPAPLLGGLLLVGLVVLTHRDVTTGTLLATPIIVLATLSVLRLAPFGGGRTDLVIYPALALATAGAIDGVARRSYRTGIGVTALTLAALLAWPGTAPTDERHRPPQGRPPGILVAGRWPYPQPYPLTDVRPLVEELEERREPEDPVLLDTRLVWPFALYTSQAVDILPGHSLPGIAVAFADYSPTALGVPRAAIADATRGSARVWTLRQVGPPRGSRSHRARLRQLGFRRTLTIERQEAQLSLWLRCRPRSPRAGVGASEPRTCPSSGPG